MTTKTSSKQAKKKENYQLSIIARHKLRQWYKTPLGKSLCRQESRALASVLPKLFGYHLLQISNHGDNKYLEKSLIRHQIIADYDTIGIEPNQSLKINAHQLGIASDSVDVVVMPHTLDLDMAPHLVLREADRVLVPEGKMVILGFNPWSTWGMRHLLNIWHGKSPYDTRFISPSRLKDWLVLLGYEVESVDMFFFRLPFSNPFIIKKFKFLDKIGSKLWPAFGAVYLVVAKKQVSTLTPVKPRWFLRRRTQVAPGFLETRDFEQS